MTPERPKPTWEFRRQIDVPTLVAIAMLMSTVIAAWTSLSNRITAIETKLDPIWVSYLKGR